MDDSSNKFRRCGQIGDGEDDEVSMEEVLQEQARLQADASALFGGSDPSNCSYPKGYLKRQALYACATCTPNGNAGICLACSYTCHEGHDLYELYTKRFFCCDCGNDKFSGKECKLLKDKEMNSRNRYNQNFKGLYCSCVRPYPDPEDTADDEMIQCVVCEDWHHGRHLKTLMPEDFFEMICPECMTKYPFLWAYHILSKCDAVKQEENFKASNHIDVGNSEQPASENEMEKITNCKRADETTSSEKEERPVGSLASKDVSSISEELDISDNSHITNKRTDLCGGMSKVVTSHRSVKRERDTNDEREPVESKVLRTDQKSNIDGEENENAKQEGCLFQSLQKREYEAFEHATFWSEGWRSKLCKCLDCMEMYKDKGIDFLLDESDTVHAYEEAGKIGEAQGTEEEEEENMFAGMHQIQQIEIAQGVRDLKTELTEFLAGFAREGKVVTEADVRDFFQSLEEKRRRRMTVLQDSYR